MPDSWRPLVSLRARDVKFQVCGVFHVQLRCNQKRRPDSAHDEYCICLEVLLFLLRN